MNWSVPVSLGAAGDDYFRAIMWINTPKADQNIEDLAIDAGGVASARTAERLFPAGRGWPLPLAGLERGDFSSNHHPAPAMCWSMIFSEKRLPLFGIML
jgi:hypothetical protein